MTPVESCCVSVCVCVCVCVCDGQRRYTEGLFPVWWWLMSHGVSSVVVVVIDESWVVVDESCTHRDDSDVVVCHTHAAAGTLRWLMPGVPDDYLHAMTHHVFMCLLLLLLLLLLQVRRGGGGRTVPRCLQAQFRCDLLGTQMPGGGGRGEGGPPSLGTHTVPLHNTAQHCVHSIALYCTGSLYSPPPYIYHHHHQKTFRNKSHTSHGQRPGL